MWQGFPLWFYVPLGHFSSLSCPTFHSFLSLGALCSPWPMVCLQPTSCCRRGWKLHPLLLDLAYPDKGPTNPPPYGFSHEAIAWLLPSWTKAHFGLVAGGYQAWGYIRPFPSHPLQVFLPRSRGDAGSGVSDDSLLTSFSGPKTGSPFPKGHSGATLPSSPALCGASACDISMRGVVGEQPEARIVPGRGICLDLAILDSAFLLSQVAPSLFMGSIVQLSQSVTAYMVSAAGLGLVAIYFATQVIFDKSDLAKSVV